MNRAVFLDRDGVINEIYEGEFIKTAEDLRVIKKSIEGIKLMNSLGLKVIVVTNTPQVARGLCTEEDIKKIHQKLQNILNNEGAFIDGFYYCPHHPETHHKDIKPELMKYRIVCKCRKPNTGMIEAAAKDFNIDVKNSFLIGDRDIDIKAGKRVGCKIILVKTSRETCAEADFIVDNVLDATNLIKNILEIKTVILVGGRGERLRPLTDTVPKSMLPIKCKPILEHLVELNAQCRIDKIVMAGHYLFDKIKEYFRNYTNYNVEIEYVDDGKVPLGSGGALRKCSYTLPNTFIVLSGDVFTNINLWDVLKFHLNKKGIATLVVRNTDHPHDSDIIEIDNEMRAVKFYNRDSPKKIGTIANASIFVFEKDIINFIEGATPNLEKDVISKLIKTGKVYCYLNKDYFIKDVGTVERYNSVEGEFDKFAVSRL